MTPKTTTTAKSEKRTPVLPSAKRSSRPPTNSNSSANLNSVAGNLAVQRAAQGGMIQAKPSISQPGASGRTSEASGASSVRTRAKADFAPELSNGFLPDSK